MSNFQFVCTTCGGKQAQRIGKYDKCLHCGNKYRVSVGDDALYMNLQYAMNERQEADFDKAKRRYDSIIADCKDNGGLEEAYWGKFLCEQYVIFYQNDDDVSIPSFWNVNNEPYSESKSYKKAIECAKANGNTENAENYRNLAERIEIYKAKYRDVKKENPDGYDIFICFKDSGTDDGNFAYELYNKFSKNYNVFFSRRSLVQIKGNDYEPYIYHALQTAKVLFVICSAREHLESKWVHNEWWRFLKFAKGTERTVIPIFRRGFDISQLPDELRNCQGAKENDINFLTDLNERLSYVFQSDDNFVINDFDKKLNKVEAIWQSGNTDQAEKELQKLVQGSSNNKTDHINAMLLQVKFLSNNYKHLNDASVKSLIEEIKQTAMPSSSDSKRIYLNDLKRYKQYKSALSRQKFKIGFIAVLIAAVVGAGAVATVLMMQDPLTEIYLTGNPQTIEIEYGANLMSSMPTVTTVSKKGNTSEVAITNSMVSGFDSTRMGVQTVTVTHEGITINVNVNVVRYSLDTPTDFIYENGRLTWSEIARAESYTLELGGKEIKNIPSAFYEISSLEEYKAYTVRVKAIANSSEGRDSDYSESITLVKLAEASNLKMNGRTLSWDAIANCSHYDIYLNGSRIATANTNTYTIDAGSFANGKNEFYVLPVGKDNVKLLDSLGEGENLNYEHNGEISLYKLAHVSGLYMRNGSLSWTAVAGGSRYSIYANGEKIGETGEISYSIPASSIPEGDVSVFVVCEDSCNFTDAVVSDYENNDVITVKKLSEVTGITINSGVLSWNKVEGALKYEIYVNGKYSTDTTSTTYRLDGATSSGDATVYTVKAVGDANTISSGISSESVSMGVLKAPTGVRLDNGVLYWDAVIGALGYRVYAGNSLVAEVEAGVTQLSMLGKLSKGEHSLTVMAYGNGNNVIDSAKSASVTYSVSETVIYISDEKGLHDIVLDLNAVYVLANDITISGTWSPIGTTQTPFNGRLNGNGHSISGLKLVASNNGGTGLFGVIGAEGIVENIKIENVVGDGTTYGNIGAIVGKNYGTVREITVSGSIESEANYAGGIIGRNYGHVYGCKNSAEINGANYVGGIAGRSEISEFNVNIYGCENYGTVNGTRYVGGIMGQVTVGKKITIYGMTNTASVTASGNYAGGIFGYIEGNLGQTGTLEACLNSGAITASDYATGCFAIGSYITVIDNNPSDASKECVSTGSVTSSGSHSGEVYTK